tara:strand:+ start:142 stop:585 length:444 start_codon:yes stop_codon:yes gene_type:complete
MKSIRLEPEKNSLSEIKTWIGDDGSILSQITEYRDGVFNVFFPESDEEEQQMLADIWGEPDGKTYPEMITDASQNIDLSDYVHEMISLGVASIRWEVKRDDDDVRSEHSDLLDSLEDAYEDIEDLLEEHSWEEDLQYFLIGSVATIG